MDTVDPYGIKVPGDKYPGFCIDLPAGTESIITGGRVIVTGTAVPRVAGLQGGKYLLLTGSGTLNVTGNDIISDDNGSMYSTISYGISMSKTLDAQLIVDGPTVNASGGKGLHSTKWWMTSSVGIQPYIFMFNGKLTARGNEVASRGSNGTSNGITIYDGEFYAYGNDSGIGDGSGSNCRGMRRGTKIPRSIQDECTKAREREQYCTTACQQLGFLTQNIYNWRWEVRLKHGGMHSVQQEETLEQIVYGEAGF